DPSDFDDLRQTLQGMAQDFADERQEALENMPEALQDGSQAQEYAEAAESWADEVGNVDEPGSEPFEDCDACDGTGEVEGECGNCGGTGVAEGDDGLRSHCDECSGTGQVEDTCQECDGGKTDVLSEDWVEEAKDALREA